MKASTHTHAWIGLCARVWSWGVATCCTRYRRFRAEMSHEMAKGLRCCHCLFQIPFLCAFVMDDTAHQSDGAGGNRVKTTFLYVYLFCSRCIRGSSQMNGIRASEGQALSRWRERDMLRTCFAVFACLLLSFFVKAAQLCRSSSLASTSPFALFFFLSGLLPCFLQKAKRTKQKGDLAVYTKSQLTTTNNNNNKKEALVTISFITFTRLFLFLFFFHILL